MSIRITALYIFVIGLSIYAWKDWFKSLCGLILLMAVIDHPDMPKSILGIQGLNLWNVLFVNIAIAWASRRRFEGLKWDMPRPIVVLLLMYMGVILIGILRAAVDRSNIEWYSLKMLISEELINTIKWILPGILLFDGCRSRRQAVMALFCLLTLFFLVAVQVVRCMPPEAVLSDSGLIDRARIKLNDLVGYSASDISVMLGGACWGIVAALSLIRRKYYKIAVLVGVGVVTFGQALTGGRIGYAAWGATGLLMCLIKWRKYLILAPVVVILLPVIFPGAAQRMLMGFGQTDVAGQATVDEEAVTSGRTLIWPYVINKIGQSPIVGYGRLAMNRTGLVDTIETEHPGTGSAHPHNMYLETILDNGMLGSIPIFVFWAAVVLYAARLFRSNNRLCSAVGGLSLALTLASLLSGIGGQHFYPQEHTLGIWAAFFLSLRVYIEEKRALIGEIDAETYWNSQLCREQAAVASVYA